jgi:hypothetical protein
MFQWYQWSATPEWILVARKGDSLPHVDSDLSPGGEWLHAGDTSELPASVKQDLPASVKQDIDLLGFFLRRLENVDRPMSAAELATILP